MTQLILAEPGLENATGHYFAHARVITEECERRGLALDVLVPDSVDPAVAAALPCRPVFRVPLHAQPRMRQAAYLLAASVWAAGQYRRDFAGALDGHVGAGDLLLLNTVTISVLDGVAGWLASRPKDQRPATAVMLRFGPEEGLPKLVLPHLSRRLYRRALDRLHRHLGSRLLLATDTRLIGADFERLIGRTVAAIPLPLVVPAAIPPRDARRPVHFVFLGAATPEKGFHLLPDALEAMLAKFPDDLVATVQVARPRTSYAPLVARLKAMAPRVNVIEGALDDTRFQGLLSEADAVLLPYDPIVFAKRSSQILAEAAALGRPVIVIAESFLDREMRSTGIVGIAAAAFTAEALTDAMAGFIVDRPRLVSAAWEACPAQRQRHDSRGFIDRLLAFVAGAPALCG